MNNNSNEDAVKRIVKALCADGDIRKQALTFIAEEGPSCVGAIDSIGSLRAATELFACLENDGLVFLTITRHGPEYRLTDAGFAALRAQ